MWTAYTSCDVLPLHVFVDCLIDNKLDTLTIQGKGTEDDLKALWLKLYSEYCTLSQNESMTAVVIQIGHIEALQAKIQHCKRLVSQLYIGHNEVFEQCLKDWGYRIAYESEEGRIKALDRIVTMLRGEEERLTKLIEAIDLETKNKASRADFIAQLAVVTKYMHTAIRLNDPLLTVAEYCSYLKMMKQQHEAAKTEAHAG